jgi:hypothetical protein
LIGVRCFCDSEGWEWAEFVADFIGQCLEIDVSGSTNDDVLSNIEVAMILFNLLGCDGVDDLSDAVGGLSEEMVLCKSGYTLKAV